MGNYYQVDNNTGRLFLGSGGFDDGALLAINSTTHGFLLPRMTTAQRDAIDGGDPTEGLVIYNTDDSELNVYDGSMWTPVGGGGGVSYPLLAPDGSTSAPSYSFTSSTNSGLFYNAGSSSIALVNSGAIIMQTGTSNQRLSIQPGAFPTNSLLIAGDQGIAQFASPLTLVVASSTIKWGTSNQLSLTASNPSATGRSVNLPDPGTTTADILLTESSQTVIGEKSFRFFRATPRVGFDGNAHIVMQVDSDPSHTWDIMANGGSGNPLTFTNWGFARITTVNAQQQWSIGDQITLQSFPGNAIIVATSTTATRTFTLPDITGSFAMLEGAQTFTGVKSFGANIIPSVTNTYQCGTSTNKWSDVWGTTLHSGDIELDNHWKITEGDKVGHPEEGVMLLSPEGKKFKLHMTEVQ